MVKYDDYERGILGSTSVTGLAFVSTSNDIFPVESLTLTRYLPSTHFYRTTLKTEFNEYSEVETLVSSAPTSWGWDIRTCLSPTFRAASPKFLAQFEAIRASGAQDQEIIARSIAALFAAITYKGHVGHSTVEDGIYTVELWWDQTMFRLVKVKFEKDGSVAGVVLWNPKQKEVDS